MVRGGLLFFAVLEVCHIFADAQCIGGTICLSPLNCGQASLCVIGAPGNECTTSSFTSSSFPTSAGPCGCQSPFASAFNEFSKNLEVVIYSILTDSQLDAAAPCIVVEELTKILTSLNDELATAPGYVKGQYTCLLACMLDQLEGLSGEYGCT